MDLTAAVHLLIAVLIAGATLIAYHHLRLPKTTIPVLPGGHWFWGNAVQLQAATATGAFGCNFGEWIRKYGDSRILALRSPGGLFVLTNDLDCMRRLNADRDTFISHEMFRDAAGAYARGVIALEGEEWHVHRTVVQSAMKPENLRIAMTAADAVVTGWLKGMRELAATRGHATTRFDISRVFMYLYLDVMGRAMLSTSFGGGETLVANARTGEDRRVPVFDHMTNVMIGANALSLTPKKLWRWLADRDIMRRFHDSSAYMRQFATRILDERLAAERSAAATASAEGSKRDFMHALLETMEAPKQSSRFTFDHKAVVDEIMIMLLAATETSAHTTTWLVYSAIRDLHAAPAHACYQELFEDDPLASASSRFRTLPSGSSRLWQQAYNEVVSVVGESLDSPITWEMLERLHFVEGWLKETLRLYNTVPAVGRQVIRDTELMGHAIPKGSVVAAVNTELHMDQHLYGKPAEVLPERWFQDAEEAIQPKRFAFNAFSGGVKMCVGQKFAYVQMKVFVIRLLQAFRRIDLAPDAPRVRPSTAVTTRPVDGLHVEATWR